MKYIIFENGEAIIFSETANHRDMAGNSAVKSAGYCRVETYRNQFDDIRAKVDVWGDSYTLKVVSHPEDAKILENIFR